MEDNRNSLNPFSAALHPSFADPAPPQGDIILPWKVDYGVERKRPLARLNESLPLRRARDKGQRETLRRLLWEVLEYKCLSPLYQPVVSLENGGVFAFEASVRGPSDGPLHIPANLYAVADENDLLPELDRLAWRVILEGFARLGLPGQLMLRLERGAERDAALELPAIALDCDLALSCLIVEPDTALAEPESLDRLHARGVLLCQGGIGGGMDAATGDGWRGASFGRLDSHFVQGIHLDPVKQSYLKRLQEQAAARGMRLIADGVEATAVLPVLRDIGIGFGQGPVIARSSATPSLVLPADVVKALQPAVHSPAANLAVSPTAENLLVEVPPVRPEQTIEAVYEIFFTASPNLVAIPVVKTDGTPIGLINRYALIDRFARPFRRELYGKRHCTHFMDSAPLIVDKGISIEDLSNLVVEAEQRYLSDGFIITDGGRYAGMGTGHALMREITQLKITAARYSNPLTGLPGNVPINEHIDQMLRAQTFFCVAYCDLNHFKPFNDVYGYNRGDDVIQLTGRLLAEESDPGEDFVGHVGGDDFVVLFRSGDWEARCQRILDRFGAEVMRFFSQEDVERGGYVAEDRRGQRIFHPLTSLAIGVVRAEPGRFASHREVAATAAEAKKQAKATPGNSLFVDRRSPQPPFALLHE